MRLIDADELIKDLDDSLFYSDAIPFVEEAPTVDAVPVELIQKLENPYNPIEYQQAFAGFETAKCQLILKHGKKVEE